MKVELPRKPLADAVKTCLPVVPNRTTKEALKCAKIEIAPAGVTVIATDLEAEIRVSVPCDNLPGTTAVLLDAGRLSRVLETPEDEHLFLVDSDPCRILFPAARFELATQNPDLFPALELPDNAAEFEIDATDLRRGLELTAFACAKEANARFATTGVAFVPKEGMLELLGADTKRLAVVRVNAGRPAARNPEAKPQVVPLRIVKAVLKSLPAAGPVTFRLSDRTASFEWGGTRVASRVVEGRIVPYEQIMPKSLKHTVALPCEGLATALRQARLMTDDENMRCRWEFAAGNLNLGVKTAAGVADVNLPLPGSDLAAHISFDPSYVAEMLAQVGSAVIQFGMNDAGKPAVFQADGFYYLVMPLSDE